MTAADPDSGRESAITERVWHEEELLNRRITWMLTFQGLLFAAFTFGTNPPRPSLGVVIPFLGMAVATLGFMGVVAAYAQIDAVRKTSSRPVLPGATWRKALGRINSIGIPVVVAIAWAAIYGAQP